MHLRTDEHQLLLRASVHRYDHRYLITLQSVMASRRTVTLLALRTVMHITATPKAIRRANLARPGSRSAWRATVPYVRMDERVAAKPSFAPPMRRRSLYI